MKAIRFISALVLVFSLSQGFAIAKGKKQVSAFTDFSTAAQHILHYPRCASETYGEELSVLMAYSIDENGKLIIHDIDGCGEEVMKYVMTELEGIYLKYTNDEIRYVRIIFRLI